MEDNDRPTTVAERGLGMEVQDAETGTLPARAVSPQPREQPQPQPRAQVLREVPNDTNRLQAESPAIIRHSPEIGQLFGALAEAQANFTAIEKSLKAKIESRREGARGFEYTYAPLDEVLQAVRPALSAVGIAVMQFPFSRYANSNIVHVTIRTLLGHKSGEWMSNDLQLIADGGDPKAVGGAITYGRRYAIQSLLGVAPEVDDDAPQGVREQGPQPAQRRSQQEQAKLEPKGKIAKLEKMHGGALTTLDNGYRFQTRDAILIAVLERLRDAGKPAEFTTKPSSDPSKYAPILTEILPTERREPGEEG